MDGGSRVCGYCRETLLLAPEYLAEREEGEADWLVGPAKFVGWCAGNEYGAVDEGTEVESGEGRVVVDGGEG